jgi:predicted MFS family arabinose efflux permease
MSIKRARISRDLLLFLIAIICVAFGGSLIETIFNNFLDKRFAITSLQRTLLEFPREIPGLITMLVAAALSFLCIRRLAVFSMVLAAAGAMLMGFLSGSYSIMVVWLFVYSLGQHLFMPLNSDIGMELAHEGKTGKRLGQLHGVGNLAAIAGSAVVFIGFKYFDLSFEVTFVSGGVFFLVAALLIWFMRKGRPVPAGTRFAFSRKFRLYYLLSILYGSRKQIFITFAPWILVTVYEQPVEYLAKLFTVGGIIGIVFKPLLGRAIDRYGERLILAGEALALIIVCVGYGFARQLFAPEMALLVASACFVTDLLLMSVGMARATYVKKVAANPQEVTAALTAGISIDHIFSISVALLGGLIWNAFGYEYVFLLGGVIALANFFVAMNIGKSEIKS